MFIPLGRITEQVKAIVEPMDRTKRGFHNALQRKMVQLAEQYGCTGKAEFLMNNGEGKIDVVWYKGDQPEAFFEIDSRLRFKSMRKLQQAKELNPKAAVYWIYYGGKQMWPYPCKKWDPKGIVGLIRL